MSNVSANDVLETVWDALVADGTLTLDNYLGGVNRIVKGPRKPDDLQADYYLTMNILTNVSDSESKVQEMILQVVMHCKTVHGAADTARMSRVMNKVVELLDDTSLTFPSNVKQGANFVNESPFGPLWSSEREEHFMPARFRFIVVDKS